MLAVAGFFRDASMPNSTRHGVPRHGHGDMVAITGCNSVLPCPSRSGPPGSWSAEAHGWGGCAKMTGCGGRWQAAAAASDVHTMESKYAHTYICKKNEGMDWGSETMRTSDVPADGRG